MLPPLPKGWVWPTLAAIAALKGGITKGQKRKAHDRFCSVPYLRVANVQRGYLDLAEVKQIEATEEELQELRLFPGDILFNEGGDRDKLGRGWIWRGEIPECIHQNHVFRARLYLPELQPKLISWYGNSFGQRYFVSEGKQTTNLASINLTKLGALPIPLPPVDEQHRIVAEIETQFTRLDATVTALHRVQANLKRYRASVLQAACEGRLVPTEAELARADGRPYEPADQLLHWILQERRTKWEAEQLANMKAQGKEPKDDKWKRKYSEPVKPDTRELPDLPEGWGWASLDQLLSFLRNGISEKPDGLTGLPILRISSVQPMSVDFDDIRFLEGESADYQGYILEPGNLLFTRYNGTRSLVGVCAIVPTITEKFVHPDKIIRCKVATAEASVPGYLEVVLNTGYSRRFLEQRIRTTAGQSGVSGSDLRQIPVPLPLSMNRIGSKMR